MGRTCRYNRGMARARRIHRGTGTHRRKPRCKAILDRWAQPAVEAAIALQREHGFTAEDIAHISIETFREAVALGSQCSVPKATDEAQYSLPYPVTAMLVFGAFANAGGMVGPVLDWQDRLRGALATAAERVRL